MEPSLSSASQYSAQCIVQHTPSSEGWINEGLIANVFQVAVFRR